MQVRASAMPRSNFDDPRLAGHVENSDRLTWLFGLPRGAGGVADDGWRFIDNDPAQVLQQETFRAQYGVGTGLAVGASTFERFSKN